MPKVQHNRVFLSRDAFWATVDASIDSLHAHLTRTSKHRNNHINTAEFGLTSWEGQSDENNTVVPFRAPPWRSGKPLESASPTSPPLSHSTFPSPTTQHTSREAEHTLPDPRQNIISLRPFNLALLNLHGHLQLASPRGQLLRRSFVAIGLLLVTWSTRSLSGVRDPSPRSNILRQACRPRRAPRDTRSATKEKRGLTWSSSLLAIHAHHGPTPLFATNTQTSKLHFTSLLLSSALNRGRFDILL